MEKHGTIVKNWAAYNNVDVFVPFNRPQAHSFIWKGNNGKAYGKKANTI